VISKEVYYISLKNNFNNNSSFYAFYSLIINYINTLNLDYDFMTKEILCKYDSLKIHIEDIRMFELENFKVANCLYIHPQLEVSNIESEKEALIMIYQKSGMLNEIKKETYISIVSNIYSYYYDWDKPFFKNSKEENDYIIKHQAYLEKIQSSLIDVDAISLNGYPIKHPHSSDNAIIPIQQSPTAIPV